MKKEILHHYNVSQITMISIGLFMALVLVCSGWYMTAGKLDSYIASNTNYRQLRLDISHKSLQHYLDRIDSLYNIRPNMRKMVLETEKKNFENMERLEKQNDSKPKQEN